MKEDQQGDIVSGRVVSVRSYGVVFELPNGDKITVPSREMSWDDEKISDISSWIGEGDGLPLKCYRIDQKGDRQYSARFAEEDPWDEWCKENSPCTVVSFTVTSRFSDEGYGEVIPGIEVRFSHSEIEDYFRDKEILSRFVTVPFLSDAMTGVIRQIDSKQRLVDVDVVSFLRKIEDGRIHDDRRPEGEEIKEIRKRETASAKTTSSSATNLVFDTKISRVLVVEDKLPLQEDVCKAFRERGLFVQGTEDLEEAHVALGETDFDLITVDLVLNGDDGAKFVKEMCETHPGISIAIYTGLEDDVAHARLEGAKVCGIWQKPMLPDNLVDEILREATSARSILVTTQKCAEVPVSKQRFAAGSIEGLDISGHCLARVNEILRSLVNDVDAEKVGLFALHPVSGEAALIAQIGLSPFRFKSSVDRIFRSPVKDVIFREGGFIQELDVNESTYRAHRNLIRIVDYQSCIGVRVEFNSDIGYALFVFHSAPRRFFGSAERVRRAGAEIALYLQEDALLRVSEVSHTLSNTGLILGWAAHEIRTQLALLGGNAKDIEECVSQEPIDAAAAREMVQDFYREMGVLTSISSSILDLASRSGGKERSDALEVVLHVLSALDPMAKKSGVALHLVNGLSSSVVVNVKEATLISILLNLVLNALQQITLSWREIGEIFLCIRLDPESNSRFPLYFEVIDSGPGIHTRDKKQIFDPLISTKPGGFGLGLSLSRRMVEDFGGRLEIIESFLFEGTTFALDIPERLIKK